MLRGRAGSFDNVTICTDDTKDIFKNQREGGGIAVVVLHTTPLGQQHVFCFFVSSWFFVWVSSSFQHGCARHFIYIKKKNNVFEKMCSVIGWL